MPNRKAIYRRSSRSRLARLATSSWIFGERRCSRSVCTGGAPFGLHNGQRVMRIIFLDVLRNNATARSVLLTRGDQYRHYVRRRPALDRARVGAWYRGSAFHEKEICFGDRTHGQPGRPWSATRRSRGVESPLGISQTSPRFTRRASSNVGSIDRGLMLPLQRDAGLPRRTALPTAAACRAVGSSRCSGRLRSVSSRFDFPMLHFCRAFGSYRGDWNRLVTSV